MAVTRDDNGGPRFALEEIVFLASLACSAQVAYVAVVEGESLRLRAQHGFGQAGPGIESTLFSSRDTFVDLIMRGAPLYVVPDVQQEGDHPFCPLMPAKFGFRFFAGVPVAPPGKPPRGVLGVMDTQPRDLREEQRKVLLTLGRLASYVLENEPAEESTARDAAALFGKESLVSLLNRHPVGLVALDPEGKMLLANETAARYLDGATRRDGARHWRDMLPLSPPEADLLKEMLSVASPSMESFIVDLRRSDGTFRHVRLSVEPPFADNACRFLRLEEVPPTRKSRNTRTVYPAFGLLVGRSTAMREMYAQIEDLGPLNTTVLIEGETGTGKELVARALHNISPRASKPFVAVNLAGLSETLWASQLFGHKKGAFTGAVEDQIGLFEFAQEGTLFLDEVADAPPAIQVALLRVLQEREILRLGDVRPRTIDVRVLAASNRRLKTLAQEKVFREDLYYRLAVARIEVPALRERKGDIALLAQHFLNRAATSLGKDVREIHTEAHAALSTWSWPGNVRELENAVESAVIRTKGTAIGPAALPAEITSRIQPSATATTSLEHERLLTALRRTGGNCTQAAQFLGISRATLYRRLRQVGIEPRVVLKAPFEHRPPITRE